MRTTTVRTVVPRPAPKGKASFYLTGGVAPSLTDISWFRYSRPMAPLPPEVVQNRVQQSFFLSRTTTPVPSPFVGSPVIPKRVIPSFLNIRGESQHIRSASNLAKIDTQVLSHAMDSLQSYADTTDNTIRGLAAQVNALIASQAATTVGLTTSAYGPWGAYMPNPKYPVAYVIGSGASGDVDLYTVPANRKALLMGVFITNLSGGFISIFPETKIGGIYRQMSPVQSFATGVTGAEMSGTALICPKVLLAGETFSVNMTATGLTVWGNIIEFDDSSPLTCATLTSFSAGDNLLYTVPNLKTAQIFPFMAAAAATNTNRPKIFYFNISGGVRVITVNAIPSGSSASINNRTTSAIGLSSNNAPSLQFVPILGAGDTININVDIGAGPQIAWVNVIEH